MKPSVIKIAFFLLMISQLNYAQLSPGKLSKSHSQLEGLSNCTKCHTVGEKIDNKKCLDCHNTLAARVNVNKGYHASSQIKGKDCITCHSEHHGLNFQMIRFDKATFDHNLTGYKLEGGHKKVKDCKECHKAEHISNLAIKKDVNTYLGLDPKCTSCHEDYHQKSLSQTCTNCHTFETFETATKFSHTNTDFPLLGAHKKVDCKSCHEVTMKNGKSFQVFADVKHSNCNSCHTDVHKGSFGANCKSCHNEESFHTIKSNASFNHSNTGFALKGKHDVIDCKKCHDNRDGGTQDFQEFKLVQTHNCINCHKDVHEAKFGTDCAKCHDESSFHSKKASNNIDHSLTNFPLLGKHQTVDCKACHKADFNVALAHNKCMDCHSDKHNGEFTDSPFGQECASCHTADGFNQSTFTLEQHAMTKFQLTGSHVATPCFSCHLKNETWKFSDIGSVCKDCHQDIHTGFLSEKFYLNKDCTVCHATESWAVRSFDHGKTNFILEGKHFETQCSKCHFPKDEKGTKTQRFKEINTNCITCHDNVHGDQFVNDGGVDCKKCHGFKDWTPINFNHDNTRFKLEGAHKELECSKCHQPQLINGKSVIEYKINKLDCRDCHG